MPSDDGRTGFTLIELLIVISLISVLTAIAIPQFLSSRQDAVDAAVLADLATMRDAVERYFHQHDQTYPGMDPASGEAGEAFFIDQMTGYTDREGHTAKRLDRDRAPYGPYLRRLPENPKMDSDEKHDPDGVRVVKSREPLSPIGPKAEKGWAFNCITGELLDNTERGPVGPQQIEEEPIGPSG